MAENTKVGSTELAEWFGVTRQTVIELTRNGILHQISDESSGRTTRKYDLKATMQEYSKYLRDRAAGRSTATEDELKKKKLEADIALKESQGELHRLKTAITNGEYISIQEVQIDYDKFFVTFKKFAMGLPSRVIGLISGSLEPAEARKLEKELSDEVSNVLQAFVVAGTSVKPPEAGKKPKLGRKRKGEGV